MWSINLFLNIGRPVSKQNSRKMLSTFAPSNENKYKNDKNTLIKQKQI